MNDTLKAAGRIGAELGAAKAENDRLREVLSRIANLPMYQCSTENDYRLSAAKAMAVAALSQQAEPECRCTMRQRLVGDGCSVCNPELAAELAADLEDDEQAQAQDEREAFEAWVRSENAAGCVADMQRGWMARATRPAQTEQQPVMFANAKELAERSESPCCDWSATDYCTVPLYAAPIAQAAPLRYTNDGALAECPCCGSLDVGGAHDTVHCYRCGLTLTKPGPLQNAMDAWNMRIGKQTEQPEQSGKFAMHQRVRKTSGSEWQGRICGTYSTPLTPEGYAVESEAHAGSVQIYPSKALEAVDD